MTFVIILMYFVSGCRCQSKTKFLLWEKYMEVHGTNAIHVMRRGVRAFLFRSKFKKALQRKVAKWSDEMKTSLLKVMYEYMRIIKQCSTQYVCIPIPRKAI